MRLVFCPDLARIKGTWSSTEQQQQRNSFLPFVPFELFVCLFIFNLSASADEQINLVHKQSKIKVDLKMDN